MFLVRSRKLIIGVLIIPVAIVSLIAVVQGDQYLYEARGYGFLLGRAIPPGELARETLNCIKQWYQEKGAELDWSWPDAKTIAANVPGVLLVEDQPYTKFGIYILKSKKTKQLFLCFSEGLLPNSKLGVLRGKLWETRKVDAVTIFVCVMAAREEPRGVYHAYKDYPSRLKKTIGAEAWKTWYFIEGDDGFYITYYVQSDVPPIPGCLAYTDQREPQLSKFYYPEEIMPAFKAIYPNTEIPQEQILREGKDY